MIGMKAWTQYQKQRRDIVALLNEMSRYQALLEKSRAHTHWLVETFSKEKP